MCNGKAIGFISIWEEDSFIHSLFIDKNYRGIGIGTKLIEYVVNLYGKPLSLKCLKEHRKALDFYINLGWTIKKQGECPEGIYYLIYLE